MENEIDYVLINEYLADYIEKYQYHPYIQNLSMYANKMLEVVNAGKLDDKLNNIKCNDNLIDFVEGISLVKEYLRHLSPTLEEHFDELFRNGVINIEYIDEASMDDDYYQEKNTRVYCASQDYGQFISINVTNGKTNIDMLVSLIHEFFHATNVPKKNENFGLREMATEVVSIYYGFDFLKYLMKEKGYPSSIYFSSYRHRYNDTFEAAVKAQDISVLLYKKIYVGTIKEDSYKIAPYTCSENVWNSTVLCVSDFLKRFEKRQKEMKDYQFVFEEEKKKEPFKPHVSANYVFCAPVAYHLSKSEDPEMPYKMLDFNMTMNVLPYEEALSKIGFKFRDIIDLNYTDVMNRFKNDIVELSKSAEDSSVHSFRA